jgi:hypothetical protein
MVRYLLNLLIRVIPAQVMALYRNLSTGNMLPLRKCQSLVCCEHRDVK